MFFSFFLTGIESLPYDLQRNFSLQRDLDQRAHGMIYYYLNFVNRCNNAKFCEYLIYLSKFTITHLFIQIIQSIEVMLNSVFLRSAIAFD